VHGAVVPPSRRIPAQDYCMETVHISPRVYTVAALFGLLAPIIITAIFVVPYIFLIQIALEPYPSARPFPLLVLAIFLSWLLAIAFANLVIGSEFGKRWPGLNWRWGLWISVPCGVLLFVARDLQKGADLRPPVWALLLGCLLLSTLPACLGARLSVRRAKTPN